MKKILILLLTLVLSFSCAFACAPANQTSQSQSSSAFNEKLSIQFLCDDEITVKQGETFMLEWEIIGNFDGEIIFRTNNSCVSIASNGELTAIYVGKVRVTVWANTAYDFIDVNVTKNEDFSNPYDGMTAEEFYADYTPATSYLDSLFRSQLYFMSGSIESQDQAPTIADNQPIEGDLYLKNSNGSYSADKNIYYVLDKTGETVKEIYKGGAYVTLEEVAAYIFAFNDIPANYVTDKKTSPSKSPWGEYLRLNHSRFSGSTSKYPYEPELPNISGCGGDYEYYEVDLGTTGTTAGEGYAVKEYNDGSKITRGAARIVYSRYENGNAITDLSKKHLFYTYNHYNDFQEYLNYYNGWGEIFGNITGGGTLSNKDDCNPTPYVEVVLKDFCLFSSTFALAHFEKYLQENVYSVACANI